jgi:hypothetical protein
MEQILPRGGGSTVQMEQQVDAARQFCGCKCALMRNFLRNFNGLNFGVSIALRAA